MAVLDQDRVIALIHEHQPCGSFKTALWIVGILLTLGIAACGMAITTIDRAVQKIDNNKEAVVALEVNTMKLTTNQLHVMEKLKEIHTDIKEIEFRQTGQIDRENR